MLADNKLTASCSVTSSALGPFDKFMLIALEIFMRLLEKAIFAIIMRVEFAIRACNHCHVPAMLLFK